MSLRGSESENEAFWRDYLTHGRSQERRARQVLKHVPHEPRCRLCAAPFAGFGGPLMRLIGKRPSTSNPNMCSSCFDFISSHHGGAEIEVTMLFADIRGSTTLAEGMSASEYRRLLDRFYTTAAVNITARLASAAAAGEILVTADAAAIAGLDPSLARRRLELKGRQGTTEVVSLRST